MQIYKNVGAGFSRMDLIAAAGMLAALLLLALPALGKSHSGLVNAICLNNKRLLTQALVLYTHDNDGWLPPNDDVGSTSPGFSWAPGSVASPSDATNFPFLTSPKYCALATYLGGKPEPFKCPADQSTVRLGGRTIPVSRSVSMNSAVGTKSPFAGEKSPVDAAWLTGSYGHTANRIFYCYGRLSHVVSPSPASLWVILDEAPDSINDAAFGYTGPGVTPRLIDWPAAYHGWGAGFGFMDGHAEITTWMDTRTSTAVRGQFPSANQNNNPDLKWLAEHGTARIP